MDFLDPKKKRNRKIRLAIGHTLMALAVLIGTYILVFTAYGYEFNTETGEVTQDGLVYFDSTPSSARITLNGEKLGSTTNTRVSMPEGNYSLKLSKDGYYDWQRNFNLQGGEVVRYYTYPFLFPKKLDTSKLGSFAAKIDFATQSPDKRWILLAAKDTTDKMTLYDLDNRTDNKPEPTLLTFPASLFTTSGGSHVLKLVEWSTDNKHLLIRHNYHGGKEFIVLDIDEPARSYNVSRLVNQNVDKVNLFDKKFDKLFVYDSSDRILTRVDIDADNKTVTARENVAGGIISYKPHGDDTILMSRVKADNKTKAEIIMRQDSKNYKIREVSRTDRIPLDVARYDGSWYVVIASEGEHRSYIYKDPINLVSNKPGDLESVRASVLNSKGHIDKVSFSQNARFIMSSSDSQFGVYDAETEHHFSYSLKQKLNTGEKPYWMDGSRIIANSKGKTLVFDYDGLNLHTLVKADPALQVMFDDDYTELYSLRETPSSKSGKYSMFITQLRTPADR